MNRDQTPRSSRRTIDGEAVIESNPGLLRVEGARPADRTHATGKRVLLIEFDLYKAVGGGQSAYRRLIELNPENTYYYFSREEPENSYRPTNAMVIKFYHHYYPNTGDIPVETMHFYNVYLECWQMAASIRSALGSCSFDVVDVPDYVTNSLFIRSALLAHDIHVGVVALALHGTISSALRDQWPQTSAPSRVLAELRMREHLQYRHADVRYALSVRYGRFWEDYGGLRPRLIDPLLMVGDLMPAMAPAGGAPDILFVGRRERRKGPDLFADFVWGVDPATYGRAIMIGGDASATSGVSSADVLPSVTARRKITLDSIEKISREDLDKYFANRSIVALPSRYDQFNLVALESLRLGCPTFVSRHAGVAAWIEERYPQLAHLVVDIDCSRSAVGAMREALLNYDEFRKKIVDVLEAAPIRHGDMTTLETIYQAEDAKDDRATSAVTEMRVRFDNFNRPRELGELGRIHAFKQNLAWARPMLSSARNVLGAAARFVRSPRSVLPSPRHIAGNALVKSGLIDRDALISVSRAAAIEGTRSRLLRIGERTSKEINAKLSEISNEIGTTKLARAQIFRDMARLERKRGADLIAATYCLRVMRWLERDVYGDLDFVIDTLRNNHFFTEADVAYAMFGDPKSAEERCRDLLETQSGRHLNKPDLPLEIEDDRRGNSTARVAVIVSLYNAESKLRHLLQNMSIQSIAKRGELELILVDSGSPTNEYAAFKAFAEHSDLPMLYIRSRGRETIQSAWNRGIKAARAPYLAFLGVDEGLHPDALLILSGELDAKPDVDWVMADSIVTNVDADGVYASDIMTYDRRGYHQNLVYLETCYLSWVGGLYRKSIHDRFGYYDETFRAAGDTEFKSRILHKVKTLHVPKMLGVFNNYPEERTTQHPRAEIEDLRAWYLHRTVAGISYSFDNLPIENCEDLFLRSLSYRKSFCNHLSTDFAIAASVGSYLARRQDCAWGKAAAQTGRALNDHAIFADSLDFQIPARRRQLAMLRTFGSLRRQELIDQKRFDLAARPTYRLMNDNRYEQHWWSWST